MYVDTPGVVNPEGTDTGDLPSHLDKLDLDQDGDDADGEDAESEDADGKMMTILVRMQMMTMQI